jgi:two-component system, LytTR family, response regulator
MQLSAIIIDDQSHAIDLLTSYITKAAGIRLISSFTNPLLALEFLQQQPVDVIFLDIDMEELTGLEFMDIADHTGKVILTTGHEKYARFGYEYDAVIDYLLKPIKFDRFMKSVLKANAVMNATKGLRPADTGDDFLLVKTEKKNKFQKIRYADILYIQSDKNYVSIYTDTDRTTTLSDFKALSEKLPGSLFFRVHKSFIVALPKIDSIESNQILIKKPSRDIAIPIGLTFKEAFFQAVEDKMIGGKSLM